MATSLPKFRPDIVVRTLDEKDGGRSFVLEDPVARKYFRIFPYEYDLLKSLDGTLNLKEVVERLRLKGRYYTVGHAAKLVDMFSRSGLLLGTPYGTARTQTALKANRDREMKKRALFKFFYLYLPLFNPDRFLGRMLWLWRILANHVTLATVFLLAPGALYLIIVGYTRWMTEFLYFFNTENLIILWVAIASVKILHEFSHAFTAKDLGLTVPEMGVAFLMFFPCLYCNTTAAWELADRKQRMAIAAAGIISELVIAVLAIYVWYFTKPGLLNSTAFYLAAVSLVSSLFFNGNPLMKFDGYFILTDFLQFPNLQQKALSQIRNLILNRVFGVESVTLARATISEHAMLMGYGISAIVYRFFLYSGIIWGVYTRFDKTIGVVLGLLAFFLFAVRPLAGGVRFLITKRAELNWRPKGLAVFVAILMLGLYGLMRPWSSNSLYPCYLQSEVTQQVVIPADAPIAAVFVRQGDLVRAGQVVLKLDPTALEFKLKQKEAERELIRREIQIIEHSGADLARLPIKTIELSQAEDAIRKIKEDLENIEWKAPFDGAIIKWQPEAQPGAAPGKGTPVGEIADVHHCVVTGLVREAEIDRIKSGVDVQVWFPVDTGKIFPTKVKELNPFRTEDLEGSPLSSRFGGEIATEPKDGSLRDAPVEPHFVFKADFDNSFGVPLGITGKLVVHEPPLSLLERVLTAAVQTFRRELIF